jgi:hypothetical protein
MSDTTYPLSRGESELEAQLALMTAAVARCFALAEGDDRTEYGTLRQDEYERAARLLALSGSLGAALAKIRGKFEHEIKVMRDAPPATAATPTPLPTEK